MVCTYFSTSKSCYSNLSKFDFVDTSHTRLNRKSRVEIQVFRGANNEEEQYAPWGFIIRQPSDFKYDERFYSDIFGEFR